jgi:hypothetical protein
LYVDDLTLSGIHATKSLLFEVKKMITLRALTSHKDRLIAPGTVGLVTGVALKGVELHLRNKQHHSILKMIEAVVGGDVNMTGKLTGKLAAARIVEPEAANKLTHRFKTRFKQVQENN